MVSSTQSTCFFNTLSYLSDARNFRLLSGERRSEIQSLGKSFLERVGRGHNHHVLHSVWLQDVTRELCDVGGEVCVLRQHRLVVHSTI